MFILIYFSSILSYQWTNLCLLRKLINLITSIKFIIYFLKFILNLFDFIVNLFIFFHFRKREKNIIYDIFVTLNRSRTNKPNQTIKKITILKKSKNYSTLNTSTKKI